MGCRTLKRLTWFAAIWGASVVCILAVAWMIRFLIAG